MGKSRRNRSAKAQRADPIAPKTVKPPSDPELAALRESKILPVLKDLKSPDAKSRTTAAGAIANIIEDPKCRKLLLREQVVHTLLTETLTDTSIDSRAAGWRILKVLAQEEDSDFCVHLYRVDVLSAIQHAAQTIVDTISATAPPFEKLHKAQQQLVWEIAESLVFLLTALATARDEILEGIVANSTVLRFLFRLVATSTVPHDLHDENLQLLMILAEDNLEFGQALTNEAESRPYDLLVKMSDGTGFRAVLACGILHNVFTSLQWQDQSPGKDGACDTGLVPILSRILEQTPFDSMSNGHGSGPTEILQTTLEILASIGTDLQSALERGNKSQAEWGGFEDAPAAGSDEDIDMNDDTMDVDGSDDEGPHGSDDDELDEALEEDMAKVTGLDEDEDDDAGLEDLPTLRELLRSAVPHMIRLSNTTSTSNDAVAIRGHAMSALGNIAWTVSLIDFTEGENAEVLRAWAPVAKKIWAKTISPVLASDSADLELATLTTSLAWALSRSLGGETPLQSGEHRQFMSLYQASKSETAKPDTKSSEDEEYDPFQTLSVKCIGVLGQLARHPAPLDLNRDVAVFLFTVLEGPDAQAADVVEAVNQIMDIYGDETVPCDQVFWSDNFLEHLQTALPNLRTKAKGVDKRSVELRQRFDEMILNLTRFINYKKKHMPKTA